MRPNGGGYNEHRITDQTPTEGQYNDVEIYWYHNEWSVTLNSVAEGSSTNNPAYGKYLATGVESTSNQSSLYDALSNGLAYKATSGSWVSGWGSSTGLRQDYPAYAQWDLTDVNLLDGM